MAFHTLSESDTILPTPFPSSSSTSPSTLPNPALGNNTIGANGQTNFFSPTTSPPLILAFLAIGLFSVAMIAMFGWRRIQYGRGWAAHLRDDDELNGFGPGGVRGVRGGSGGLYGPPWFGEKPKLWDLWPEKRTGLVMSRTTVAVGMDSKEAITTVSVRDEDIRWDNITPLSFDMLSSSNGENDQPQEPNSFGGSDMDMGGFHHMRIRSLQGFRLPSGLIQPRRRRPTTTQPQHRPIRSSPVTHISRYFGRHNHGNASTSEQQDSGKVEKQKDGEEPLQCAQVAVIVAMPSRENPCWLRSDDASRDEGIMEYAIGVYRPV